MWFLDRISSLENEVKGLKLHNSVIISAHNEMTNRVARVESAFSHIDAECVECGCIIMALSFNKDNDGKYRCSNCSEEISYE